MSQGDQGIAKTQIPESEKGYGHDKDNAGRSEQNPGTSRGQQEDRTGTNEERGQADESAGTNDEAVTEETNGSNADSTIRNPSGDDLGDAIDGDEGSGRRV